MPRKPLAKKKAARTPPKTTPPRSRRRYSPKITPPADINVYLQRLYENLNQDDHLYLFSRAIEQSPVAIIITDFKGVVEYINPRFSQLSGTSQAGLAHKHLKDLGTTPLVGPLFTLIWETIQSGKKLQEEIPLTRRTGDVFWEELSWKSVMDRRGKITHYLVFLEDITERKISEARIDHLVKHDPLTNLPNRDVFNLRLRAAMEKAFANHGKLAICLLGLDQFKFINYSLGHTIGDFLITEVATRLSQHLTRQNDFISRMGGDEFLLLLTEINSYQQAVKKVEAIMEVFTQPFVCDDRKLHINSSIGISLFPEDGLDPLSLLKNADAALNEAKENGRNVFKFYTAKLSQHGPEKLALENAMRLGLEHKEFLVYYQPQVSLETGKIIGMEALVRWVHPELGLIPPDMFIPLAEETGLIVPLGQWVLETACLQNLAWQRAGFKNLRMAVNFSARQFQQPELVETVLATCQRTGMDPHLLELEITESIFMKDTNIAAMVLKWLHKKGLTIAIDDFGTGYSSLTYLKRFPIEALKIDRSFIRDYLTDSDNSAIIATICSIAKNLDMRITAEGVETPDQLAFLANLGCNDFQGYLFSPPVPGDEFTKFLEQEKSIDPESFQRKP